MYFPSVTEGEMKHRNVSGIALERVKLQGNII